MERYYIERATSVYWCTKWRWKKWWWKEISLWRNVEWEWLIEAALSRNKFKYMYLFIRFDNPATRKDGIQASGDKLEAIRKIYVSFVKNCLDNFSPNTKVTVDERLATFLPFQNVYKEQTWMTLHKNLGLLLHRLRDSIYTKRSSIHQIDK